MKLRITYLIALVTLIFSCEQKPSQTEIAAVIESMINASEKDSSLVNAYANNDFKPIWVEKGGLKKTGRHFLEELEEVVHDGLEKSHYISEEQFLLIDAAKDSKDPSELAELDIALSKSFLELASDLNIGRIDPASINIEWKLDRKLPTANYEEVMLSTANGTSAKKSLDQLRPENAKYAELRNLLKTLLDKPKAETAVVKTFEGKIELGDNHEAIPQIRQKLVLWGDLNTSEKEGDAYDETLFQAVKNFQARHGLIDDGVIGADFIEAINYSQSDLITKIKVNLERLRWLPDFSETDNNNKVIVNIPDFNLFYVQKGDTILTSRVVVGKDYRQTPVFKSEMTYLVFSPTWTLPETILWEDAIPSIQKDVRYLAKHKMQVLDYDGNEVDYKKINWNKLEDKGDFPYMLRQVPGPENPLGQVKFMFPNDYSIYIHDSPAKALFSRDERTFSSGCIRMEKPEEFAALLLKDWDEKEIVEAMGLDKEKNVTLEEKQEVWILYLSIWESNGKTEVREDVYGMDRKLAEKMALPVSGYFL